MGWTTRTPGDRWKAQWRDPEGVAKTFDRREEAKKYVRTMESHKDREPISTQVSAERRSGSSGPGSFRRPRTCANRPEQTTILWSLCTSLPIWGVGDSRHSRGGA
jgi:hypothetical protein